MDIMATLGKMQVSTVATHDHIRTTMANTPALRFLRLIRFACAAQKGARRQDGVFRRTSRVIGPILFKQSPLIRKVLATTLAQVSSCLPGDLRFLASAT